MEALRHEIVIVCFQSAWKVLQNEPRNIITWGIIISPFANFCVDRIHRTGLDSM
jgi:hypothetical protein